MTFETAMTELKSVCEANLSMNRHLMHALAEQIEANRQAIKELQRLAGLMRHGDEEPLGYGTGDDH